ncbi:SigB/SigF/SigG family RNA polymerase sigma factor [Yinghuangia soli]|uniref:SigB/SigF/SigG family RNA polymerase sigma factor n=1 Tax=Yinghuangia soli TaxID=2908204 RepID=A0AA41U906_9ACTN|nr:SigB/SigF/SigG family RNA polymerase sigma factor [Yinghuangia soli]MCF2533414.1 SigB/SigF/SigG family RNA polymerase sigma factor [Yinghuangia soli]
MTPTLVAPRRAIAEATRNAAVPSQPAPSDERIWEWDPDRLRSLATPAARAATAELLVVLQEAEEGTELYSRVRSAIVSANFRLVLYEARRYRNRDTYEDVVQTGMVGLIKAINAYDPAYGGDFARFALPTVRGEIKRFFRDTSWAVHVPRSQQENYLKVTRAADELQQQLGREATEDEIAAHTGLTKDEVDNGRDADRAYTVGSLDAPPSGGTDARPLADIIGYTEAGLELVDLRESVKPLIAGLDERDRTILRLRFWEDLTQSQIGERLGISQMHVSRLITRILAQLRDGVEAQQRVARVA